MPVTETFEYQLLLIELGRLLKLPVGAQHILSMAVFAIMHYAGGGLAHGLCAGLVGGFYLAWTYLYFRQRSFWLALGMTIALHSLHNFICIWI
ncbi:hypothetical protein OPIT5_29975 [Opitutaceae bacterium TAV5]|nr:hypothetical protein OPIT5_29975 [Opitutaceae bacterium TAV5]